MSSCHKLESRPSSVGSSRIPALLLEEETLDQHRVQSPSAEKNRLKKSSWQHQIPVPSLRRPVKQLQTAGAAWPHSEQRRFPGTEVTPVSQRQTLPSNIPSAHYLNICSLMTEKRLQIQTSLLQSELIHKQSINQYQRWFHLLNWRFQLIHVTMKRLYYYYRSQHCHYAGREGSGRSKVTRGQEAMSQPHLDR